MPWLQFLLPAFSANKYHQQESKEWSLLWSSWKSNFRTTKKMNDCFLLPFPNTHIYLWCDMLKAQSLVWALLLLLSKLDFSQGLLPCEMPCGAAWCRRSLMGSCSSQLSVDRRFCGQDCRMTESAGWEVKAFNYSFLFSVWNSWAVSKVSASVWASIRQVKCDCPPTFSQEKHYPRQGIGKARRWHEQCSKQCETGQNLQIKSSWWFDIGERR